MAEQAVLTEGLETDVAEREILLQSLSQALGNLGFLQILPLPVEERQVYAKHPEMAKHYGAQIYEVAGPFERDMVLPPTHFPGIFKRFNQNFRTRGPHVAKWFYLSPVLDLQSGKTEIVHELGVFVLGEDNSLANAQLINAVTQAFGTLGISEFLTEINSMGCPTCQKDYQSLLLEHLQKARSELCAECVANLEDNPMAVWSCANASCRSALLDAPQIVDFLDDPCRTTLVGVLETVDALGIPYMLNPSLSGPLLRQKVLFRITAQEGKVSLGTGGNYSRFTEYLGGEGEVPLLGFLTTFEQFWPLIPPTARRAANHVEVFMIPLGEAACRRAMIMHRELQQSGIRTAEAMLGYSSIKGQLKAALDNHSDIVLIIGQKEALDETVILRDIRSGIQEVFAHDRIIEEVKKRLGK